MELKRHILFFISIFVSFSSVADMDDRIIQDATKVFSEEYYRSEYPYIVKQLSPRGLSAEEMTAIVADVAERISSCIINRLEHDSSPVAHYYLILITDGTPHDEVGDYLDDAYTKEEREQFTGMTVSAMQECSKAAYDTHHLSLR